MKYGAEILLDLFENCNTMKVSVIIPTYKPKDYLWECLDSLCSQTISKQEFEIVVVLNGCCEPYKSQIQQYINYHSDVLWNFIQTDQGGVSNARNIALDVAKGEYITFLDDDDFFSKNTLLRLYEKANTEKVVLFKPLAFYDGEVNYFEYVRTTEYNKNKGRANTPFYKVRKNFSGPVMKLFPRNMIGERRYNISFKNGEDSLFMFLISDRMNKVVFAEEDAIYYRRVRSNSAATTSQSFLPVFKNSVRLIKEYTKIFFLHFGAYNFSFYLTRVLGAIKAVLYYRKITF